MFELVIAEVLTNLPAILGMLSVVGAGGYGLFKLHSNKVKSAYDKGKSEEKCLLRIEGKADDAITGLAKLTDKMEKELEDSRDHHTRMYDKLDSQDKKISEIMSNVSYIKGVIEPKK